MHILFISDNFYPEVNAAASRVYERAKYWVQWGHKVTVITGVPNFPEGKVYAGYKNRWYQKETMDGIDVIRVKTYIAPNAGFIKRTLDFVSFMLTSIGTGLFTTRPDVVIATTPQFFTAIAGWIVSIFKWRPFILEVSDLWPASIKAVGALKDGIVYRTLEKIELFLYRRATRIAVLTKAFKQDLIRRHIEPEKIEIVINGVNLSQFQKTSKDVDLIKQYALDNKLVVGYIGTLGMAHGLSNVIETAKLLRSTPRVHFLLVGAGAQSAQLKQLASDYELTNVTFVPRQPKEIVQRYWSICDIALVHLKNDPAFAEVIPSKMFEAMAMGLPILLCLPKGEAYEILVQDGAGWWVPPDEPKVLADFLIELEQNRAKIDTMAQASLQAAQKHGRDKQAEELLNVMKYPVLENE